MTELAVWVGSMVALASGVGWFAARGAPRILRALVATLFATTTIWTVVALGRPLPDRELTDALPAIGPARGYETSDTCRACHPGQYGSWHDSFHRTMTEAATPEAVQAPFDGRILEERGRGFRVYEREGRFYAYPVDGETGDALPDSAEKRIVLTTGSHHVQAYWYADEDGTLVQLPFVYVIEDARWLANDDSFLQAPYEDDADLDRYVWTDGCVTCHTTGGPWNPSDLGIETRSQKAVTELGISCERCHGPADAHVAANRSPARRYRLHRTGAPDTTIVNPRRLDADRAASLCGHCHTVADGRSDSPDGEFHPGERLGAYLDHDAMQASADRTRDMHDLSELAQDEREMVESFWTNGVSRVAGREYDAMVRSPCYLEGGMTCITCHTMHGPPTDAQLPTDADAERLCGGTCHAEIVRDPTAHTHHAADSSGSACVNCHMPHASYGLLSATRSHRLDSPVAGGIAGRDAPNACNLCHLDQSLGWTARYLSEWYGVPTPTLPQELREVPAGALWMLRGDAVQRVIAGWHAGWDPARQASDIDGLRPGLAALVQDPYSAVRQIAGRSLRTHDPTIAVDLDALARDAQPDLRRTLGLESALLDRATVRWLLSERDNSEVAVPE